MEQKEAYIKLYADEFDTDVWEHYCVSAGVPTSAIMIKISFNYSDVIYKEEE